ncbi:cyclic lactone autoinducer peptide [Metallumcola ferriviriculae]|uniref:Cyclic lactone autoinducer peptide n=1 Tax=Metallumcola ferriviriculae TaxID=3039180 RepID=A0AAU0UUX7_9FIRM|nr:cyclic lactone autoinducer peptide [Desulfitibacteraceae bacterium MK1]
MEFQKAGLLTAFSGLLAFVATLSTVTPNCIGWFYEPRKPETLLKTD